MQNSQNANPLANWKKPFFTIWVGQVFSLFGSLLVDFALVWYLTESTGSATILAMATLVIILPGVILGPFAGALVDRTSRRSVMILSDGLTALTILILALLFRAEAVQTWHIFVVMCLRSIAQGFQWPAMQASTSLMVPEQHLARIAGLNQALRGGLNIIAPPLGAILLGILPMYIIVGIDVISALLAITPLFFINIPQPPNQIEQPQKPIDLNSLWQDVRAGFSYVTAWKGLLVMLITATAINFLLTPAFALLPILVTKHFNGQALQLAWMNSSEGIGVVLGGLILGAWGGFKRRTATILVGLAGMGLGFLAVGVAPSTLFWLGLAGIFFAGFMGPLTNGPIFAIIQAKVAPEMQGRVLSLIASVSMAISPLGTLIAGPVADAFGIQIWYLVGGILCTVMGIAGFFIPVFYRMEDPSYQKQPSRSEFYPATGAIESPQMIFVNKDINQNK